MAKYILGIIALLFLFSGCNKNNNSSDAFGNFEATEILVSAESNGKILVLNIEEGGLLKNDSVIALIDTTLLSLQKEQVLAQKNAVSSKVANILSQIKVLEEQKKTLLVEKNRVEKLLAQEAATQQQLDNINGQINVIEKQIEQVKTQNSSVLNELDVFDKQIDVINEQILRCSVKNPINGVVLEKYVECGEITAAGKPLYKIANLTEMFLRAYVSGAQLNEIKIGQEVTVKFDLNETENKEITGIVSWISSEAEFTPKIIQTKEERVNLVYAVKVKVTNDGSLKNGMPGELLFHSQTVEE